MNSNQNYFLDFRNESKGKKRKFEFKEYFIRFFKNDKTGIPFFVSEIFVVIVETASLKIWNANYFL